MAIIADINGSPRLDTPTTARAPGQRLAWLGYTTGTSPTSISTRYLPHDPGGGAYGPDIVPHH
jgi:hypothetical protein